jgi:hypothetical protein
MDDIISWIKANNLYFIMGYVLTHQEFTAEIWQVYEKFDEVRGLWVKLKKTRGWWGAGQTMEIALKIAYDKAVIGLPLPPRKVYD